MQILEGGSVVYGNRRVGVRNTEEAPRYVGPEAGKTTFRTPLHR
jgi:hypothetical protein